MCGRRLGATSAFARWSAWVSSVRRSAAHAVGLWSKAGVFVRLWEYQVPDDGAAAFTAAYAPDGAWGQLFGSAAGLLGTELYHDAGRGDRYLTIDRWQTEQDWRSFLHAFGSAYESFDTRLEGLALAERLLFEDPPSGLRAGHCAVRRRVAPAYAGADH